MLSAPPSEANPSATTSTKAFVIGPPPDGQPNLFAPLPPTKIGWSSAAKQWRRAIGTDADGRTRSFWLGRDEEAARFKAAALVYWFEKAKARGLTCWTPALERDAMDYVYRRQLAQEFLSKMLSGQLNDLAASGTPASPGVTTETQPVSLPAKNGATLPDVLSDFIRHLKATKRRVVAGRDIALLRSVFGMITPELACTSKNCNKRHQRKLNPMRIVADHLDDITPAVVARFLSAKREACKLSARTCNRFRDVLAALFRWANEQGRTTVNPMPQVKKYREPTPDVEFLTLAQIGEQLAALESHSVLRAMVATYIYAGLRREEAIWLTPGDVDLTAGIIRIRAKVIGGERWQPKTGVGRTVPISRALRRILEEHNTGEMWYFSAPAGGRWSPDNFNRALAKANNAAGLHWCCKIYRHTFASALAACGRSLFEISRLMGNSPAVAARYYASLTQEHMADTVEFERVPA